MENFLPDFTFNFTEFEVNFLISLLQKKLKDDYLSIDEVDLDLYDSIFLQDHYKDYTTTFRLLTYLQKKER